MNYFQRHVLIGCLISLSTFAFGSWGEEEKIKRNNRLEDSSFSSVSPNRMMRFPQEDHSQYKGAWDQKIKIEEEGCVHAHFSNGMIKIIGAPIERERPCRFRLVNPRTGAFITLDWNSYSYRVGRNSQKVPDALHKHFYPGRALSALLIKDPRLRIDSVVEDVLLKKRIEEARAFITDKMAIEAMVKALELQKENMAQLIRLACN
jgi:hypothetical protein